MKYLSLLLVVFVISVQLLSAQNTEKWDLRKCVEYAMKNNLSVKQADVQARISALQLRQAKLYQYPNVSMSSGLGVALGPLTRLLTFTAVIIPCIRTLRPAAALMYITGAE
jgi:outer membrane protein